MSLNHINLVVKDVDTAVDLFANYFNFQLIVNRDSKMAIMESSHSFALVIWGQMLNKETDIPQYPKNFHIGFYQEDEEAVKKLYGDLKVENYLRFESEPKRIRNTFGFYFYYENLMIEVSVNPFKEYSD